MQFWEFRGVYNDLRLKNILKGIRKSTIIIIGCFCLILPPDSSANLLLIQLFSQIPAVWTSANDKFRKIVVITKWPPKISHLENKASKFHNSSPTNSTVKNNKIIRAFLKSSDERPSKISFITSMAISKTAK